MGIPYPSTEEGEGEGAYQWRKVDSSDAVVVFGFGLSGSNEWTVVFL
ncbi:hypothetical protein Hdeb2414_s0184g00826491 [Helianthus debilis subsp. tardiflorus]